MKDEDISTYYHRLAATMKENECDHTELIELFMSSMSSIEPIKTGFFFYCVRLFLVRNLFLLNDNPNVVTFVLF